MRRSSPPPATLNLRLVGNSSTNRNGAAATPSRQQQQHQQEVLEVPVVSFRDFIEETSSEDWQRRVLALEELVASIPDGSAYLNETDWFNSPKILSHLTRPIATLLRDARSSVVRRVCTSLTQLFVKCQTDGRYLFKELMKSTILDLHGQTVQVIRLAVQTMVLEVIPEVPCKSVMPVWMDRLKDKSPAVRDACALYLGHALKHWSTEREYLTDEIWHQVSTAILKTLRDPSPTVRKHAKSILLYMQQSHEAQFQRILKDEHGPASTDTKLRQWLMNLGNAAGGATALNTSGTGADELSVASRYTLRSENSQQQQQQPQARNYRTATANSTLRISTPRKVLHHSNSLDDEDDVDQQQQQQIPNSIQVSKTTASPKNLLANIQQRRTPPRPNNNNNNNNIRNARTALASSPQAQTYSELAASMPQTTTRSTAVPPASSSNDLEYSESTSNNQDLNSSPFIRSIQELKLHAKARRSRHSFILQERFKSDTDDATSPRAAAAARATTTTPEHVLIAIQLLRSHKAHVDIVMETLRLEMDVLRDFDTSLAEPGRPTELELLEYYERVDLCVEQRIALANSFRSEMEHISRGDDTNDPTATSSP